MTLTNRLFDLNPQSDIFVFSIIRIYDKSIFQRPLVTCQNICTSLPKPSTVFHDICVGYVVMCIFCIRTLDMFRSEGFRIQLFRGCTCVSVWVCRSSKLFGSGEDCGVVLERFVHLEGAHDYVVLQTVHATEFL